MLRSVKESLKYAGRWATLPIKAGPLAGMKWIAFTGTNFLNGTYEQDKTKAVLLSVMKGDTAWDIGGHVGYYAVLEAKLVGDQGQVLCFEPRPLNACYIKRHVSINRIENLTLIESAVSDRPGKSRFESRTGTGTGHLSLRGNLEVDTVAVDDLVETQGYPAPNFIKLDVEGAEVEALNGAMNTIIRHRPRMLIATHGPAKHRFVLQLLESLNYQANILDNHGKGDTEILALPN